MINIKHRYTNAILFTINTPNLRDADLYGADLYGADLYGADLRGANLRGANLCDANLRGANLRDANLCGANLRDANLRDANLYGANLRDADLCGANLYGANLYGANIYGADLYDEKLKSNPIFIFGLHWTITITNKYLTIGCQRHLITAWQEFSDEQIKDMHNDAFGFWKTYKAMLMQLCAIQMMKTEETSDD